MAYKKSMGFSHTARRFKSPTAPSRRPVGSWQLRLVESAYVVLACRRAAPATGCRFSSVCPLPYSHTAMVAGAYFGARGEDNICAADGRPDRMAGIPDCQMAKFDPFLSLDFAPTPSTLAQSKERKGSNFAICQPLQPPTLKSAAKMRKVTKGDDDDGGASKGGKNTKLLLSKKLQKKPQISLARKQILESERQRVIQEYRNLKLGGRVSKVKL